MNKTQSNKANMYSAVITYLSNNQAVVDSIPVMVTMQASFNEIVKKIFSKDAEREAILSGKTLDKKKEEEELLSCLLKVVNGLSVYASVEGKNEILQATDYLPSEIKDFRDNELIEKANSIFNMAESIKTELTGYGLAETDIEALKTNADEFAQSIGVSGSSNAESKLTTAELKGLFSDADELLYNKLDKLALVLKNSNEKFYEGYNNARQIIDR